jgi:hypothetical protein
MSSTSLRAACSLLTALVLLVGLGAGHEARANEKVDWSEYLEPPGTQHPVKVTTASQPPVKSATKAKKASRTAAKPKRAAKTKSPARRRR